MGSIEIVGRGVRKLKPLSASLSFGVEGGGLVQAVNAVTGEHIPDWRFTPIRIRPIITVTDPEGLVTNGVHNSDISMANMRWLYDETGVNVLVGVSSADMSVDASASDLRGSLNIRKNFDTGALLRFEFEFSTSAGGVLRTVKHSGTIAIVVNQMADALVQVWTVYPRGQFVFFPQPTAPADLLMQMQLYYKGEACPAAYKWFKVAGGNESATGASSNMLSVPAVGVAARPNYRCKALDMRPEYASAMEAAMGRARADVYKKYLGGNWAAVLPTVRPNLYEGEDFVQDGGFNPVAIPREIIALPPSQKVGISYGIRFISEGSEAAATFPELMTRVWPHSYGPTTTPGTGFLYFPYTKDTSVTTKVSGSVTRLSSDPSLIKWYFFYPQKGYASGEKGVKAAFSDIKIEIIEEDGLPDTTPYLPHADKLSAEIRARAAEIVAANPPTPPAVWPLERTYIRDFTLSTQTIPYELLLRIEGLGEAVIVRNGSLARGAGPAQELFSNVPRDMSKFRASIVCRQGRHTYTPEQTAAMFDVTWPAGSEGVNGCKAVMTSLDFNLSITPKYL